MLYIPFLATFEYISKKAIIKIIIVDKSAAYFLGRGTNKQFNMVTAVNTRTISNPCTKLNNCRFFVLDKLSSASIIKTSKPTAIAYDSKVPNIHFTIFITLK